MTKAEKIDKIIELLQKIEMREEAPTMPDTPNRTVTFTPPDYGNSLALDALVRLLTGDSASDFERKVQQNLNGAYDFLYEEEPA